MQGHRTGSQRNPSASEPRARPGQPMRYAVRVCHRLLEACSASRQNVSIISAFYLHRRQAARQFFLLY
jgi:hypothetical protein